MQKLFFFNVIGDSNTGLLDQTYYDATLINCLTQSLY